MNIRFHGCLVGNGDAYVNVDGIDYLVKKETFDKFNYCTNGKWLTEEIEYFAYKEIIEKGFISDEFFAIANK